MKMIDELDVDTMRDFYDNVVEPLEKDEVYLIMGQFRRKYADTRDFGHDPITERRIIRKNGFEYFFEAVRQVIAVSLEAINYKTGGKLPHDAFVVYFDIFPKSTLHAYFELTENYQKRFMDIIQRGETLDVEYKFFKKIVVNLVSEIHKYDNRNPYIILDLDDRYTVFKVMHHMRENNMLKHVKWISVTRGGHHLILDNNRKVGKYVFMKSSGYGENDQQYFQNNFEEEIREGYIEYEDVKMTPVPGTFQGGHCVSKSKILSLFDY